MVCWGFNDYGQTEVPSGTFRAVSVGVNHTCALHESGEAVCWGDDSDGKTEVPEGTFRSVSTGGHHACGLRETGEVVCWGSSTHGQAEAPPGPFRSVSASQQHTCAIRESSEIACWGEDRFTQAPFGLFRSLSAGWIHSCAVRETDELVCWGEDAEYRKRECARGEIPLGKCPLAADLHPGGVRKGSLLGSLHGGVCMGGDLSIYQCGLQVSLRRDRVRRNCLPAGRVLRRGRSSAWELPLGGGRRRIHLCGAGGGAR